MPLKTLYELVLKTNPNWCAANRFCIPSTMPAELTAVRGWWPSSLAALLRRRYQTLSISGVTRPLARELHDKHFLRKHGRNAYYGQPKEAK